MKIYWKNLGLFMLAIIAMCAVGTIVTYPLDLTAGQDRIISISLGMILGFYWAIRLRHLPLWGR